MPSFSPTFIKRDPATGLTYYDFEGHISADGVDLETGFTTSPPDDRRIRWQRLNNGGVVADGFGDGDGVPIVNAGQTASELIPSSAAGTDINNVQLRAYNGSVVIQSRKRVPDQSNNLIDVGTFQSYVQNSQGLQIVLLDAEGRSGFRYKPVIQQIIGGLGYRTSTGAVQMIDPTYLAKSIYIPRAGATVVSRLACTVGLTAGWPNSIGVDLYVNGGHVGRRIKRLMDNGSDDWSCTHVWQNSSPGTHSIDLRWFIYNTGTAVMNNDNSFRLYWEIEVIP